MIAAALASLVVSGGFAVSASGSDVRVLLTGAPGGTGFSDTQQKLMDTGEFAVVDAWDASTTGTPFTLADLLEYDAVLFWSNATYWDPVAMGNIMADYVDQGGGVVAAVFETSTMTPGRSLEGRWNNETYWIIEPQSGNTSSAASLGTIELPSHPTARNVRSLEASTAFRPSTSTLSSHGEVVARWDDGMPLITVSTQFAKRVDLGMYPPSSDAGSGWWQVGTDGATIMANAVLYAAGAAPNLIVVPEANASERGTGGLNTLVRGAANPRTYQQQFTEAQLASQGLKRGMEITGIAWRSSISASNDPEWPPAGGAMWDDYEITFAQARNPINAMSSTFANNMIGPVTVRSGQLHIPASTFTHTDPPSSLPNAWGYEIEIDPYVYRGGDLVVLYTHNGSNIPGHVFLDRDVSSDVWGRAVSASSFQAPSGGSPTASFTITRFTAETNAETIIENFHVGIGAGTAFGTGSFTEFKAFGFRMGSETFELSSVDLSMDFSSPDAEPIVSIWSGASAPAAQLIVLDNPLGLDGTGEFSFTPSSSFELQAQQPYWVHVAPRAVGQGPSYLWDGTFPSTMPVGSHAAAIGFNFNGNPSSFLNRLRVTGRRDVEPCIADWNGDGEVDINDFFAYLADFEAGDPKADLNSDGEIDINDFFIFLAEFEVGC